MIQYLFEGPEVDIKIKPHGNTMGDRLFFRTASSAKARIQQLASSNTPKAVLSELSGLKQCYHMTVDKLSMLSKGKQLKPVIPCTEKKAFKV